jgi:Protein of unknown function, DUF481
MQKIVGVLLLILLSLSAKGQDTLYLSNGDILHGEVKSLSKGVLLIETPYSENDFEVEWLKITQFQSNRTFKIVLSNGVRPTGIIEMTSENGDIKILTAEGGIESTLVEVVSFEYLGNDFLANFSAELDVGYYYARVNNLRQFTTNTKFGYEASRWNGTASINILNSQQDSVARTNRIDGDLSFKIKVRRHFFTSLSAKYQHNEEQLLDLRSSYQLGLGKFIVNSNSAFLQFTLGAAVTQESYFDAENTETRNVETFATIEADLFDIGDLSFYTKGSVYPSVSDKGRFRAEMVFNMKYDLPFDFYTKVGVNYLFQNEVVDGALKADYVFQLTFGWEFN